MARKFNILFIVAILAATLHGSVAQRTHVVGDSLGWNIPPGGAIAYTTWASRRTFTVGDFLIFNFTTSAHTVAQVSRTSFDGCNTASPISLTTNGPANITLTTAGEHYYICTVSGHCGLGQKLAINVSTAPSTSPPPQPATPSPSPSTVPAPSPSRTPETYIVGDTLGWLVPPGGPIAYQTWAANKTFAVGDILVFNFSSGSHNVAEVTSKAAYDSCNTSATRTPIISSPARITLTTPGEHFYTCTFSGHCSLGQKLAINVIGNAAAPSPAPTRPSSSPAPSPSPSSNGATPPPSSSATPPPSSSDTPSGSTAPSTPSGVSAPPPPNSAPSFAVAALPFTFLSIALAFFY